MGRPDLDIDILVGISIEMAGGWRSLCLRNVSKAVHRTPVGAWRGTRHPAERICEMGLMCKSAATGNFGHRMAWVFKKMLCVVDPQAKHILVWRYAERGSEHADEMFRANTTDGREIIQFDASRDIIFDEIADHANIAGTEPALGSAR